MALWKLIPEEGSDFCHRLVIHGIDMYGENIAILSSLLLKCRITAKKWCRKRKQQIKAKKTAKFSQKTKRSIKQNKNRKYQHKGKGDTKS